MEAVHAKYPPPSNRFVKGVGIALGITCGIIVLFTAVLIIVAFAYCTQTSRQVYSEVCRPFYDTHVIFIAACQALIAIGFLVYGIVLLVRLNSTKGKSTPAAGNRHRQVILKIVIVLATFSILFGIRAVFFMYRPASGGRFIEGNAFLFFAYLAPDTIPVFVELFVIVSTALAASYRKSLQTKSTHALGYAPEKASTESSASIVDGKLPLIEKEMDDDEAEL